MKEKLSKAERERFEKIKGEVTRKIGTCFEVGALLLEIKESKLYREDYDTWEDFCRINYQIGQRQAAYLMESSRVEKSLSSDRKSPEINKTTGTIVPLLTNKEHTRELAKVPEGRRLELLEKVASSGPVTGARIAEAVKESKKPVIDVEAEIRDKEGYPVPPKAVEYWNRSNEFDEIVRPLQQIRCKIEELHKHRDSNGDKMFMGVDLQGAMIHIANAIREIKFGKPYAVCTTCQGMQPGKCTLCKGRGLISEEMWKRCVPEEIKAIRGKARK